MLCLLLQLLALLALTLTLPAQGNAQPEQMSCYPNQAGNGWICTNTSSGEIRRQRSGQSSAQEQVESGAIASALTTAVTGQGVLLDWYSLEAMTPEQRLQVRENCCGMFIDPLTGQVDPQANPESAPIEFTSAGGLTQPDANSLRIDGEVTLRQGYRVVTNDQQTRIDRSSNIINLQGDVRFREPGLLLRGEAATVDNENQLNRVQGASYVLHDFGAHGSANTVTYTGESGQITIDNGEFSRCEPENEFWRLRADQITLDPDRSRGSAEKVSLRLGRVPIFYYPFTFTFPLGDERISGFLPPSLGSTRSGGVDFELPYYFNIAPQADATIAPRLISDRGIMANTELRYLANWSMNTVNGSLLVNDDQYDPATADQPASDSPPVADRWFFGYDHRGRIGSLFTTFVDYGAVSDSDYFYDLGGNGLNVASRTHLNRQGRINFSSPLLSAGLNVQRIQILDPLFPSDSIYKPYDRLPEFNLDSAAFLGAGFDFAIKGQVTAFDRQLARSSLSTEQIANGALVNGERINLEPELNWSLEAPGWFLRGGAKYSYLEYRLDQQASGTLANPSIGVPVYTADSGLIFERERSSNGTQTLEPRLFYVRSAYEDQSKFPLFDTSELNFSFSQLFRDDRFVGGDRIADTDQLAVALTSRVLDASGSERLRMSIGQIHYFENRRVTLSNPLQDWQPRYSQTTGRSALVSEADWRLSGAWRLNGDVQWNEADQRVDEGSFQLRYQSSPKHIFNLAFRFRRLVDSPSFVPPPGVDPRIRQTDLSGIWPLNENWTLLGRWNYDHSNERNLESFAGVEWNNCCATIRLIAREWVDDTELFVPNSEPNRGVFVQFTLHGLGDLAGTGLSNLLQDGIRGFRESDYDE